MPDELIKDGEGNVITKPVSGWITAPVADSSVLLALQYFDNPEQCEKWEPVQIQFLLTPPQCLELAEVLTRQAKKILSIPHSAVQ